MNINILILIILWTLAPFFKKWTMISMSSSQLLVFQSLMLLPLNYLRIYINETVNIPSFNIWFFVSVIGTWISSIVFIRLCKSINPSDFIPIVQPSVIILTNIIDVYMGEKIKMNKIGGCVLIILGLTLINRKEETLPTVRF